MRLAIVAASSYEENGQVAPIPNAEVDVELFGRRLAEPDAGFTVHAFDAERGLPESIEALAQTLGGKARSLVFYFWGYALLSPERGPTLLLDGPKLAPFTLARLRRLLFEVTEEALVVVDATLAAGSAGEPLDVVRAMGGALSAGESRVSSLISVRPQQRRPTPGPPPFTGLVQMILDAQSGSPSALTPESLFRAMQAEEVMFADIPAAGCFLAREEFVVVPGALPSVAPAQTAYRATAPSYEEVTSKRPFSIPPPPPPVVLVPVPPSDPVTVPRASVAPLAFPPVSPPPPYVPPRSPVPASALGPPPIPASALVPPPIPASAFPPPVRSSAFPPPPPPIPASASAFPPPPPPVPASAFPPPPPPVPASAFPPPPPPIPASAFPPPPPPVPASAFPPPPPPPAVPASALAAPPPPPAPVPVPAPAPASVRPPRNDGAHAPEDPEGYRFLFRHYERKGDVDATYRAALCLDALGEADINESLLVSTHRPEGLQAARGTLSYADWNERLCTGLQQPETTALLRAIAPVLVRVGFQHVRRQRRERELPDDARQELEKSTTTLAKTLHWASRLLCVPVSELYVLPEVSGTLGLSPGAEQPDLVCSRALGSGFGLAELVFLWARELSFARSEQAALCYFSSASELSQLLLAALAVGGATSMRAIDGDAKRIASALKREVRGAALEALSEAAARISPHEVGRRAVDFIREAELVAGRVGLVASGNLEVSLALAKRFPRGVVTDPAERRADLLRFTVSPELGQIRASLGVAVG